MGRKKLWAEVSTGDAISPSPLSLTQTSWCRGAKKFTTKGAQEEWVGQDMFVEM